jgi:hypothetical protein
LVKMQDKVRRLTASSDGGVDQVVSELIVSATTHAQEHMGAVSARHFNVVTRAAGRLFAAQSAADVEQSTFKPLEAFNRDVAPACVARTLQVIPKLGGMGDALFAVPDSFATTLQFFPDTASMASKLASFANEHNKRTNASVALRADWAMRVATLNGSGVPPIPPVTKAAKVAQRCYECGVCVCDADGTLLWKMVNSFLVALKSSCKKGTPDRVLLADGYIVANLAWERPGSGADEVESAAVPPLQMSGSVWAHIGLQYLSPFRPTFQTMAERELASGEYVPPHHIPLQALELQVVGRIRVIAFCDTYIGYSNK